MASHAHSGSANQIVNGVDVKTERGNPERYVPVAQSDVPVRRVLTERGVCGVLVSAQTGRAGSGCIGHEGAW